MKKSVWTGRFPEAYEWGQPVAKVTSLFSHKALGLHWHTIQGPFSGNHEPSWPMSSCCLVLVCSLLCPWHHKETAENKNYLLWVVECGVDCGDVPQSVKYLSHSRRT